MGNLDSLEWNTCSKTSSDIENCSINVEFLENKTAESTAGVYLLSIKEIEKSVWQIGSVLYWSLTIMFWD